MRPQREPTKTANTANTTNWTAVGSGTARVLYSVAGRESPSGLSGRLKKASIAASSKTKSNWYGSVPPTGSVAGMTVSGFGTARFRDVEIGVPLELGDSAVTGDATLCSAATGKLITDQLVETGAALVAHLVRQELGHG